MKYITPTSVSVILFSTIFLCLVGAGCSNIKESKSTNEEKQEMYDGPELAALQEFERTKDPATGTVPQERLLTAIQKTIESKNANNSLIGGLSWIERGPDSDASGPFGNSRPTGASTAGRIRAMMVDSLDATHKTVWVGGISGGLWRTSDITASPATWVVINDNLSNLSIADICQDPRPGFQNIMYFCTGESYYNLGAVRGNGVFKSMDGGATWSYLPSTSGFTYCTRILCDYLGNIYLATRGSGVRRSTVASGGAAWTDITPSSLPNSDICDMEISSTSAAGRLHVVCGIFSTQAYRYTDIPVTATTASGWNSPAAAFPSYANRAEICVSGNTLYALVADASDQVPVIYKSTNGGANWAATGGQPTGGWASGQGWYALSCAIDPSSGGATCIVGGLDTWKTTNSGSSWTKISSWVTSTGGFYVHADQHDIQWWDNGDKLMFACDGGVFYSADKGTSMADRNKGLRIKQFYSCAIHPSTTNYFLAGAQDNGVHQFNNAGLSNTVEVTGGDGAFVAIDQDEPQYQFGSYVFNQYRRSVNGGVSWSSINLNAATGQFINPFDYDNTANIMYCGDIAANYRRWTDPQTGSTSAVVNITSITGSVTAVTVSPYTANRVYFGSSSGRVVQVDGANTIASGSAGTNLSTGLPAGTVSSISVGTTDANLICTFSNYGVSSVWVSSNGGATWTSLDNNGVNLPDMPVRSCMFYPGSNTKAYIATETGVWETDLINGTSTVWNANPTFPSVRTEMLRYRSTDRTIAAATHGRGLWTAVVPSVATPDLSFQTSAVSKKEYTSYTSGCRGYTDYTYYMVIANSPTGANTATLGIAGGGTATNTVDYAVTTNGNFAAPSMALNFASGSGTAQPYTVRIYDDDAVESPETFTLNYTISGVGNAQAGASNQTVAFTITDNDAGPVVPTTASGTIGTYTTNLQATFAGSNFDERNQIVYTAAELSALGFSSAGNITSLGLNVVTKASTQPFTGFTIKLKNTASASATGFESSGTVVYSANYSSVAGLNTFAITPFYWDGTSNLLVEFCYDNTTATANDLVRAQSGSTTYTDFKSTNATPGCSLTGLGTYAARPLITLGWAAVSTSISTSLSSSKSAYLGPNDDVYFYDASGNILARIKNMTSFDYGCTQVIIDRAGSISNQFWNNNTASYLTSKSYKVIPTNNTASGNYQITLYYTAAEVTGWQTATGQSFGGTNIVKVSNGFYIPDITPATPHVSDVSYLPGTAASFGTNSTITTTFTSTGFSGFAVGTPGAALPITLTSFNGYQRDKYGVLEWKTTAEYNNKGFELEKSYDGINFVKIAFVNGAGTSADPHSYTYTDNTKLTNVQYYRLKQIDFNQRFEYSNVVVLKSDAGDKLDLLSVTNPFVSKINMMFSKPPAGQMDIRLYDMNGRMLYATSKKAGTSSIADVSFPAVLSKGSYILNVSVDGQQFNKMIIKQ